MFKLCTKQRYGSNGESVQFQQREIESTIQSIADDEGNVADYYYANPERLPFSELR